MGLSSQQPHHKTNVEIPPVRDLTIHSMIYWKHWIKSKNQIGFCIYHLWCLPIMLCHIMSLVTSHISYCLVTKCKVPVMHDLGWQNIMTTISKARVAWVHEQHKLILAVNRCALKNIHQTAKKTALCAGGSPLNIPEDNLVLLRDHPKGTCKIQDNYKYKIFLVVPKHNDPNVYTICPLCGDLAHMVNWWQFFWLEKIIPWGSQSWSHRFIP